MQKFPDQKKQAVLQNIKIRIHSPSSHSIISQAGQFSSTSQTPSDQYLTKSSIVFPLTCYNSHTDQPIQTVHRSIAQFQNLIDYVIKQYGGYIVPYLDLKRVLRDNFGIQAISRAIEEYLGHLVEDQRCGADRKVYCFLFQQPMMISGEQKYIKVLNNASNISKKYLNSIFTRKQHPQQKQAQALVKNYKKAVQKFSEFQRIKQVISLYIQQQHLVQQVYLTFSQLSGQPTLAPEPHQSSILKLQSLFCLAQKYTTYTKLAYQRWQLLIESVRQTLNSVYKGLEKQDDRYRGRSEMLKAWTRSLAAEFISMAECFEQFIGFMCGFLEEMAGGYERFAELWDAIQLGIRMECQREEHQNRQNRIKQNQQQQVDQTCHNDQEPQMNNQLPTQTALINKQIIKNIDNSLYQTNKEPNQDFSVQPFESRKLEPKQQFQQPQKQIQNEQTQ